jgi:hypothetical protein
MSCKLKEKLMKNRMIFVWSVLMLATAAIAQPYTDTLWTRTYGGLNVDQANSIQNTTDGGFVVAGLTRPLGADYDDFYVVKINGQGDTLWTRTYGGTGDDKAYSIQQTTDSGYVVAGVTNSFGAGGYDFYVVKTNAQGDTLWTRTYGGTGDDEAYSIQRTWDSGFVVAGYSASYGAGDPDFYAVKINSQGDTLWTRTYGGDKAYCVQPTADGGFVIAGNGGAWNANFYAVKTDAQGDTLWTRTYGEWYDYLLEGRAYSVQGTEDHGFVIAGPMQYGNRSFYVVKTDEQGDTLWTHTYTEGHDIHSILQTSDGGFVVAGYTWSIGAGNYDAYVRKLSGQGDQLWRRTYGTSGWECANSMQLTSDGGFVLAGWAFSYGAGLYDFYVVKTGPAVSADDQVMLQPSSYSLSSFPNPFNSSTTIAYDLPKAGHVSLRVFDLLGREVTLLKDGFVEAGTHRVTFDGSGLASGIYFAWLDAGHLTQTKKLMLLK